MRSGVYLELLKLKLQSLMAHRGAFIWHMFAQAAVYTVTFVLLSVLLDQFGSIGSWSKHEVILLYAMNLFCHGFSGLFFYYSNMLLGVLVRKGEIDYMMTKPANLFWVLVCKNLHYPYLAHMALGVVVMVLSFIRLGIGLAPLQCVFLVVTLFAGTLIQAAFLIGISVSAFWLVDPRTLAYLMWDVKGFVQYPVSIYFRPLQIVLTFVLPFAFIAFYPAQYFLGKADLLFHPILQFVSPLVGIALFAGAYRIWYWGLNRYESTGT